MFKKIITLFLIGASVSLVLSGCATSYYGGHKLLSLPSGKTVSNRSYYENMLLRKNLLNKSKTRLETKLINIPSVPIYIHSKILRILIMPYVDNQNRLHTYQYVYFKVKKGEWLLGNYLMQSNKNSKVFNPLSKKIAQTGKIYAPVYRAQRKPIQSPVNYKAKANGGSFYNKVFQNDINGAKSQKSQGE